MRLLILTLLGLFTNALWAAEYIRKTTTDANGYSYEYVSNDPFNARIYTLENGLKVYLSVYKDEPRIYTNIAVASGSKEDPANNTGLAHYLEHIMFKGSPLLGSINWEKEKVLLDSIETLFETYRKTTDSLERISLYGIIDRVSNEAATYAVANEYDKATTAIGASGTNAYTADDETVYINDIPANELERWAMLESERFSTIIPRLFHTELEAVYEEKNRTLDNDYRKAYEKVLSTLYEKHPYGTQTGIGTIEHLKNPSITAIKAYFDENYVASNMAICLSGDLDMDATIQLIDKHFSKLPKKDKPKDISYIEDDILEPRSGEVLGPNAEYVAIGFRLPNQTGINLSKLDLVDMVLSNSEAGLIDLNLNQQQKVMQAGSYVINDRDYDVHYFYGIPRQGQTLEEVRDLILVQIENVKQGNFEDWLIPAIINDLTQVTYQERESNKARVSEFVTSFTKDIPWEQEIAWLDNMNKLTKKDLLAFAQENYKKNYTVVYKRIGTDNTQRVIKPAITKVSLNRDTSSVFLTEYVKKTPQRMKPVFVDFEKEIDKKILENGLQLNYKKNLENPLFSLTFWWEIGERHDPKFPLAFSYLEYLGNKKYSAEEFKKELYKLGCSFSVNVGDEQTTLNISGLSKNREKALLLIEELLNAPQADKMVLKNLVDDILKGRDDAKKNKSVILSSALKNYAMYGSESPFTNQLTKKELLAIKPAKLTKIIKTIRNYPHKVLYYGDEEAQEVIRSVEKLHTIPPSFNTIPAAKEYSYKKFNTSLVYWVHYDMVQTEMMLISSDGEFNPSLLAPSAIFNEYFGQSMNSILFQELRESQGLAYSVNASYSNASKLHKPNYFSAYIGTQADKLTEALKGLSELIEHPPLVPTSFELAKEAFRNSIETNRITKESVLFAYEQNLKRGFEVDIREKQYTMAGEIDLKRLMQFHKDHIQGKNYTLILIGDRTKLDLKALESFGKVKELTLEEIFGY